jgi:hypothetical protein
MKETDWRKTLEVVVKGLVGAVLVLAGLWLLGWLLTFIGGLLLGLAGVVGALLRFLIPVAAIAGIVYFVVAQLRPKDPIYSSEIFLDVKPVSSRETAPVVTGTQPSGERAQTIPATAEENEKLS